VEIYQNCPIFNDDAFAAMKDSDTKQNAIIPLVHGEPIRFGEDGKFSVVRAAINNVEVVEGSSDALVHDEHNPDPSVAFAISRLTDSGVLHQAPIGIFRNVDRPTYDDGARAQVAQASASVTDPTAALAGLIGGGDTWTVL